MKIDEMQAGREMDRLIAEKVMGWEIWNCQWADKQTEKLLGNVIDWTPSTDIAAAYIMETELEKKGINFVRAYVKALVQVTGIYNLEMSYLTTWPLIHATPEQRCKAALLAISETAEKAKEQPTITLKDKLLRFASKIFKQESEEI